MDKIIDSLYLHFPFCTHLCNYCDFYKKVPSDKSLDFANFHKYLDAAFIEHQKLMRLHGYSFKPLKTFYIGGGTPSFWGKEGKIFLEEFLEKYDLILDHDCEFTLEVNPGAWTEESLDAWQLLGANRFSLGIQTLNPELLKYLDRSHPFNEVKKTLSYFAQNNLNYSMDFMLGLPNSFERNRNVIEELEESLNYRPQHFSVYILTVKDNYKYYKNLPSEEWIEKEYIDVANYLKSKKFNHYEVSNFSLSQKESRHNLRYWESNTVAALGPSATGFLSESGLRYKWKVNEAKLDIEMLNASEIKLEKLYLKLRTNLGVSVNDFDVDLSSFIDKWVGKEVIFVKENKLFLTSKGFLILDTVINDLFNLKAI
jgi:oxygen-independent coproporphyrinogen-3 oxidase